MLCRTTHLFPALQLLLCPVKRSRPIEVGTTSEKRTVDLEQPRHANTEAYARRERVADLADHELSEEIWRLRRGDRIVSCEIHNDTRAGRGRDVRLLEAGEVLFSKRCSCEDDARFAAECFRQDYSRNGFTE
jgi:hypothetical protein